MREWDTVAGFSNKTPATASVFLEDSCLLMSININLSSLRGLLL